MQPFASGDDIIRHGEQIDDVKIETSDISNKFKFFETYTPTQLEKKQFRITPPREGVAAPITADSHELNGTNGSNGTNGTNGSTGTNGTNGSNGTNDINETNGEDYTDSSVRAAQRSNTTSKMLSKFRQMEEAERTGQDADFGPKPLKCFTPPPDDSRRLRNRNSDSENDCTDSEEEEEDDDDDENE